MSGGPNNSFKPNLLRYGNGMAGKACHAIASTTQVGLIQALGSMTSLDRNFEGKMIWLQLVSFAPPLAAAGLLLVRPSRIVLILFSLSFIVFAAMNICSLANTGWTANQFARARFQRGGDYSAIYWLHFAVYVLIGLTGAFALTKVLAQHAA